MHTRVNTRSPGRDGVSQKQGGAPLWSGLGLAAGWPGSSKPPQTEWALSEKRVGEGRAVGIPPSTHTHTKGYLPTIPGSLVESCWPSLRDSAHLGISLLSGVLGREGATSGVGEDLMSCVLHQYASQSSS